MNKLKLIAMFCLAIGYSSQALAQAVETEPNNTCPGAQNIGPVDLATPFTVTGSLDTPPDVPDVDFFRFEVTPGEIVRADLEGLTLGDPFLGLFDPPPDCNLLKFNDDFNGLNSRLGFVVRDGVFVLAASSFFDDDFNGDGCCSGTYQLTIASIGLIGSIAGRVVNAVSGEPLRGDAPPFAFLELFRCESSTKPNDGEECLEFVNSTGHK
jgi:hypothetical protein